jgi:hypothetical protein
MSTPGRPGPARPWQVTVGALQAVTGSAVVVLGVVTLAQQLDSPTMRDTLTQLTEDPRFATLNLTLDGARSLFRYTLMAVGGLSVTALVLGVFVLRRHQRSRTALTVLGAVVGFLALFAGPPGWLVTVYIAASLLLLWSRPARTWFTSGQPESRGSPPPGWPPPPPPG